MKEKRQDFFGSAGQGPNSGESEMFGDGVRLDINAGDLFGGDLGSVRKNEESQPHSSGHSLSDKKQFRIIHAVLLANLAALTGFFIFIIKNPPNVVVSPAPAQGETIPQYPHQESPVTDAANVGVQNTLPLVDADNLELSRHTMDMLDKMISLETAEQLYQQGDYYKACYVYDKLSQNVIGRELPQQVLRDFLSLRMALCLQNTKEQALLEKTFTQALCSKSIVVRAMANYHLALIQNHNQQFYEARARAYQALALLKALEDYMPLAMEADCYFIAAESLTRQILKMNNQGGTLPGTDWVESMPVYELPAKNHEQLTELLMAGMDKMAGASLMPKVEFYGNRQIGAQWSITCIDAPLEQLFWQFASESDLVMSWDVETSRFRSKTTTMFMPFFDRMYLAEVIAASSGLIWRYDGETGTIYDPTNYRDFNQFKQILIQEAVSNWQRFLLHYRTDERLPNAHFLLGKLYAIAGELPTALGSYKLVSTQYSDNALAPYALLSASQIRMSMRDYEGARSDQNDLLIRYPNCKIVDLALLQLAEATLNAGIYQDAGDLFNRVYRMNINEEARCSALYGLGRCAYETQRYPEAIDWLSKALKATADPSDERRGSACFMLGRSFIELGYYAQASGALRLALGGSLDNHEYVKIILELVRAESRQENYLTAMNIIENIPEERLNQEDSCRVLIEKTRLYTAIDLPDTAISLLRRRIEFIAEASLRAELTLELATCYLLNDDLRVAEKELEDAMYDLPVGFPTQRCGYLLAEIAFRQERYDKAERLCLQTIDTHIEDADLRKQVYGLLGKVYTHQKDYDKAALAYAGISEQDAFIK